MRIKGITPSNPPDLVKPVFQRSRELYGRVITPVLLMRHRSEILVADAKAGTGDRRIVCGRTSAQEAGRDARCADDRMPLLSRYQICRDQRYGIADEKLEGLATFESSRISIAWRKRFCVMRKKCRGHPLMSQTRHLPGSGRS